MEPQQKFYVERERERERVREKQKVISINKDKKGVLKGSVLLWLREGKDKG